MEAEVASSTESSSRAGCGSSIPLPRRVGTRIEPDLLVRICLLHLTAQYGRVFGGRKCRRRQRARVHPPLALRAPS